MGLTSSLASIDTLNGPVIVTYLQNYGIPAPVGAHPLATNHLRKDPLKVAAAGRC